MAILPIRLYPDPVLKRRCPEVEGFDAELAELERSMAETMYAAPGVGLAAPQVGVEKRLMLVDIEGSAEEPRLHTFVNPVIRSAEGTDVDLEGCLSIPGISEKVRRPLRLVVDAQNVEGAPFTLEAEGFLARAICHEIDHLDGILFIDRLTGLRKERVKRQLKRMLRERERQGWQATETVS